MLATSCQQLIEVFRAEVHDDKLYAVGADEGCLWKDTEVLRYMSEAVDALATDTEGLTEVVTLAYAAGATTVALPARILHINEARLVDADQKLELVNSNRYYRMNSCTGRPYEAYRDYDRAKLRLYPTPTEADSIEMSCAVTLAAPLVAADAVPFTKAQDQRLLLEYMKWQAYRKQDAETEDLVRSSKAEAAYKNGSMDRASELRNQRRAPGLIQMDW